MPISVYKTGKNVVYFKEHKPNNLFLNVKFFGATVGFMVDQVFLILWNNLNILLLTEILSLEKYSLYIDQLNQTFFEMITSSINFSMCVKWTA